MEQPTDDTPSVSLRSTAPSEREPGMGCAIHRAARKPERCGRFSSPLRNSEMGTLYHSPKYTPSVSHSLDSSLREGAGNGCVPFIVPLGSRNVAGDFHRPYETQRWGHCTIHRGARQSAALHSSLSTKEMGGGMAAAHWGGYCSTSNLYPTPQTVFRFHLGLTPSSFSRRRFTWTSTVRESPK